MKLTAASSLSILAFFSTGTLAGAVEKRDVACNTIFTSAQVAKAETSTHTVNVGRKFMKTITVRGTVTVRPTVTSTLTGVTTETQSITATVTGRPTTRTIVDPTTRTVAISAGFTPAVSAFAGQPAKRSPHDYHNVKREAEPAANKNVLSVACTAKLNRDWTTTITKTVRPYSTKFLRPVTTTKDERRTRHIVRTVATTTFHSRVDVHIPKATEFAACAANNLLSWTWGSGSTAFNSSTNTTASTGHSHVGISSVTLVSGTVPSTSHQDSAYDCCVKCQSTAGCVGSQFRSGICSIHTRPGFGSCRASSSAWTFGSFFNDPNHPLKAGAGLTLSNGACGAMWKYGGQQQ